MELFTRRQFLIGSLSGLSVLALDRFVSYFENHGEPLLEVVRKPHHILYVSKDQDFQIGLDQDPVNFKFPKMSLMDFLVKYNNEKVPTNAAEYQYFEEEYGYYNRDLKGDVPLDLWYDVVSRISPSAEAHHYLSSLGLEQTLTGDGRHYGGLRFYDGPTIASDYLGVHAEDDVSLSLLQQRLKALGHDVAIKLV